MFRIIQCLPCACVYMMHNDLHLFHTSWLFGGLGLVVFLTDFVFAFGLLCLDCFCRNLSGFSIIVSSVVSTIDRDCV